MIWLMLLPVFIRTISWAESYPLSHTFRPRVLPHSHHRHVISWDPSFSHVAIFGPDGTLKSTFVPSSQGISFHRIADAIVGPDGSAVLGGTLSGGLGALIFLDSGGKVVRLVRIDSGYVGKLTRDAQGRIWTLGRPPVPVDGVISIYSPEGKYLRSIQPKDRLPTPFEKLQIGTTYLIAWRQGVVWALPDHQVAFGYNESGSEVQKWNLPSGTGDASRAWISGDTLLYSRAHPDRASLVEVDLKSGSATERTVVTPGMPIGGADGRVVHYSSRDARIVIA